MNPLMLMWASYLYENGYNSYNEVMNMNITELEQRFNEVTR